MASIKINLKNKLKMGRQGSKNPGENTVKTVEKKTKKENYKQKMMRKYNLTTEKFEELKKEANKQSKNWDEYKKNQLLIIFETKNSSVSRSSSKSDVKHPKEARLNKVLDRDGKKWIDVEFGRLKEFYLYNFGPSKHYVDIRTQTRHNAALRSVREKQKKRFASADKGKLAHKTRSQAEYDQLKNIGGAPMGPPYVPPPPVTTNTTVVAATAATAAQAATKEKEEKSKSPERAEEEHIGLYVANTTDGSRKLFPDTWYSLSMSRSLMKPKQPVYWIPTSKEHSEDASFDDDPDDKFTVTAEKLIAALESGATIKESGVVEPKKVARGEKLATVQERYQKTCGRDICYVNTLKGTIEFGAKGITKKAEKAKIQAEPPTLPRTITFGTNLNAFVFEGRRMKRHKYGAKEKDAVKKFVEERKDYTREVDEATSGL